MNLLPRTVVSTIARFVLCSSAMLASLSAQTFHRVAGLTNTQGQNLAGLVQGNDGNFWGSATDGGKYGYGSIFKVTPNGKLTVVYNFCSKAGCVDGQYPLGSLIQPSDGNFYGVTNAGGAAGNGSVFKLTPAGVLTTLYSFCQTGYPNCSDGRSPAAGLVRASNGSLYGTTNTGGNLEPCGTVFKITAAGKFTSLHKFSDGTDGCYPLAPLVQATDGNLYGTTKGGSGAGTVFRITPSGTLTTIYNFCSLSGCADGADPEAGLIQGTDKNLYGTTNGQSVSYGTVFKITLDGVLTTLHTFCSVANCADGANPQSGLVQASDGNFYGTNDGLNGGTIFEITPGGTLTTLYTFCLQTGCLDGLFPDSLIFDTSNGTFYGTTHSGGLGGSCSGFGCGDVFSLNTGLPALVEDGASSAGTGGTVGSGPISTERW